MDYFQVAKDISKVYMAGMEANRMNWADFSSAPKTGREILVFYPHQSIYALINWNKIYGYWESKGRPLLGIENQDVKWMELPLPPERVK